MLKFVFGQVFLITKIKYSDPNKNINGVKTNLLVVNNFFQVFA